MKKSYLIVTLVLLAVPSLSWADSDHRGGHYSHGYDNHGRYESHNPWVGPRKTYFGYKKTRVVHHHHYTPVYYAPPPPPRYYYPRHGYSPYSINIRF